MTFMKNKITPTKRFCCWNRRLKFLKIQHKCGKTEWLYSPLTSFISPLSQHLWFYYQTKSYPTSLFIFSMTSFHLFFFFHFVFPYHSPPSHPSLHSPVLSHSLSRQGHKLLRETEREREFSETAVSSCLPSLSASLPSSLFTEISERPFPPSLSGLDSTGHQQVDSQNINVWIKKKRQQPCALRHSAWPTICLAICLPLTLT